MEYRNLQEIYWRKFETRSGEGVKLSILIMNFNTIFIELFLNSPNYKNIQYIRLSKNQFFDIVNQTQDFMNQIERKSITEHCQQYVQAYGPKRTIRFYSNSSSFKIEIVYNKRTIKIFESSYENWRDILDFIRFEKFLDRVERHHSKLTQVR